MAYTINPVLHHYADKNRLYKIYIQIILNRKLVRVPTNYKVTAEQFDNGAVVGHPKKTGINGNIRNQVNTIESRLVDSLRNGEPSKLELIAIAKGEDFAKERVSFVDFIKTHVDEVAGKRAPATSGIYMSLIPDLNTYDPNLTFDKIDISWLNLYEKYQRSLKWDGNTIHKKMSKIKTLLCRAADQELIEEKKFKRYTVPVYVQKIPEYISEEEMKAVKNICDATVNKVYKMAGYYFLLACYAGYRLSDLKKFDHLKYVKENNIILRAKKNKAIIMMPLHTRLAEILTYVKENPLTMPEPDMREYVKELVKLAGIKRHIKIHTARHSFAMMLMDNGFDLEEVAALLGVSTKTAAIYGHISNKRLEGKVKSRLG